MGDLASRISGLTSAERALLEARLRHTETQHNQLLKRPSGATPPLSFGQQRFWFIDQWEPGNAAYNSTLAFRIDGPLDEAALDRSLTEVARRHEALRTTYAVRGEALVQLIAAPAAVTARRATAARESAEVSDPDAVRLMTELASEPFDLRRGPLWRTALLRLAPQRHLLVVTIHHSVFDGWSIAVLARELFTLYEAFAAGQPSPLPELPLQYADFALWQHQQLHGDRLHRQLEYWRHHLAHLTTLDLPTDYARPPKQTFAGAVHELSLPPALVEAVRTLSRDEGATLFMTLLAAFQTLLHRYTRQTDLVVGTPIAGRTHAELEPLIGFFVNMLVLRTNAAGDPSFRTLLRQVRQVAVDAFANQNVPFEKLVDALHPPRDPSRNPLFQVVFALQNARRWSATLRDLVVTTVDPPKESTRFDLEVHVHERDRGLRASFVYNTALFTADTIGRFATHFHTLLEAIVRNPDQTLSQLSLLTPAERTRILRDWNQTVTEYPRHAAVHDLFHAQAQATPEAIAVVSGAEHLTYRQLNERANQLAHQLIALGVGPDVLVGVCLERSIEMVVAVLATLKAGGAYVPLDPAYPRERLAFMLQDANVPVLLTGTNLRARLPVGRASVVCLDTHPFEGTNRRNPGVHTAATDLAYVIYTSGSTGQPKGVAVNHRGVVRLVRNTNYVQLGPGDRLTQLSNPSFDAATFEIWGALLNGGTLVIIPRAVSLSATEFARVVQKENISTIFLPTGLFHQIASAAPGAFHRVRDLLVGGEACDPTVVRKVLNAGPPQHLVNAYGPTESTTFTTYYHVENVNEDARSVPIGRPIANTSVYILDPHLQPVPVGVVGELYIGGDGLAREYLNRPELTAERFIEASVEGIADTRLYKSGDFARYLSDGSIDFVGRIDQQLKVRGFRVELQEIEATLADQPGVNTAVVIPVTREHAGVTLVAYVVPADGAHVTATDLRDRLRDTLPEYMVPSTFVMVDAIPLTANGKADRARLLATPHDEVASNSFSPARTVVERELARIWEELLGVERIGIHDNFFDIGGHSLLAIQVIAQVEKRLGTKVPVALLFQFPTVAQLARFASEGKGTDVAMERCSDARRRPLSFGQQRFWFIDQWEPRNPAYNTTLAFQIEGHLDPAALDRSLTEVARRHETLRTTYDVRDEALVQVIAEPAPVTTRRASAANGSAEVSDPDAIELMTEMATEPFDLRHGPLWRSALLQLAPQRHLLVLTIHHSIFDGWSTAVLAREVFTLYEAFAARQRSPLPELALQYADFAIWQRQQLDGDRLHGQLEYWQQQLADLTTLDLPTDYARPPKQTFTGAVHELPLPPALVNALRTLSRDEGATVFMTLLAAFHTLLHRYTGQTDLVVGTPIAGRTRTELEPLIGFFVNMLVLRANASGDPAFRTLLRQVRQISIDAFDHQDVPFEKLVEALQPPRDPSRNPLFQVLFALQNAPRWSAAIPDLTITTVDTPKLTTRFDLEVHLHEHGDRLRALFVYNTALFTGETIGRLAAHFHTLLDAIVRDPDQRLSQLPLLAPAERRRILNDWNRTITEYPRDAAIHDLFQAQAQMTPDAIAVVSGAESLTYRQLDERANELAQDLIALDVGTDVLVGVCLERSIEMVVAVLAILKAGGAYVPLDPAYPRERLAFMLDDAHVRVLLTDTTLQARLPAHRVSVICLDCHPRGGARQSPEVRTCATDLAYVIYTSGSTGQPKGVAVNHRGVIRLVRNTNYIQLDPADRLTQVCNPCFDVATFEIWGALLNGGTLVIIPRDVLLTPSDFARVIREQNITTVFLPTAVFHQMATVAPEAFHCLRDLLIAGEVCDPTAVRNVLEAGPPRRLVNAYGPTESTTFTTYHCVDHVRDNALSVPIGRPISNTSIYILDPHLQPVPVGVVGELYIGGDGLAREYLNRPDLTAERFIEVSIDGLADGRLYKSGDFARYLPDGSIDFVGRIDGQIKIRGFRVESQEIEAALAQQPGVSNAVVIPVKREQTGVILVAYVVPAAGEHVTADDLRDRLRLTLPEYMVPSTFVMVDAIPLTPNGKADRARLSATPHEECASNSFEPPRTGVERELAHIWGELLGIERIGIHDNFFDIGGHSLLAVQVIAHVEKRLGRKVPVARLFQFPTVAQLARFASEEEATEVAIERRADATAPPLSFGQQRFWFIDQLEPGNPAYNTTLAFRIEGRLDPAALDRSLTDLVRRHEALRTTYALRDEALVQLIAEPAAVTARRASAANGSAEVSDPDAIELMTEMATEPFDLRRGPLWRTALLRLAPQRHLLVMTIHHSVFDGWSIAVLARELFTLYAAFAAGQPSPLPELAVQYADFAIWQRQHLHGDRLDRQLEYWRHQLADLPTLDLPTDYARPPKQTFAGAVHEVALPLALADALRTLSRDEGATLFMTLLAAFHTLLHRYTGQTDLVVGTPIAGRTRTELEPLIGFFVNMLVLRANAGGDPSFRTLLRQIKQGAIDAFTHQDVPFEKLVEALQPPRDPSRNPLFQVVFALQNAPRWTATLPDLAITTVEPPKPTTRFDLEVYVHERGGLRAQFVYNTALFTADTIGRLAGHFHTVLDAIVRNPDYRLSQLPLLAPVTLSTPKITTTRSTRTTIAAAPGERSTPMTVGAAATGFVAPRSQVEWQLARIWEELIGVAPIGVIDNFFDLGGHSLMLVQLIARIEQRFDRTLPVSILFESPTIEQLAIALSDEQRTHRPSSSLVPLHTRGPLPPFFWIHGDSSNAMLPTLLGPDRPLFALEHQAHDGQPARYTEVETIAAHYLEEIRAVNPRGPYLIGGYSFGGVVAFEMAQQLSRRQEDVALLFLLDPTGSTSLREADSGSDNANHSTVWDIVARPVRQIHAKTQKFQRTVKMMRCKACVAIGRLLPPALRSAYIIDIYRKALRSYGPQPYSGRAIICKTLSMEYSSPRDWPNLITGPLTIHECDATHDALMKDPHIRNWAAKLKDGLTQADVDARASATNASNSGASGVSTTR